MHAEPPERSYLQGAVSALAMLQAVRFAHPHDEGTMAAAFGISYL